MNKEHKKQEVKKIHSSYAWHSINYISNMCAHRKHAFLQMEK